MQIKELNPYAAFKFNGMLQELNQIGRHAKRLEEEALDLKSMNGIADLELSEEAAKEASNMTEFLDGIVDSARQMEKEAFCMTSSINNCTPGLDEIIEDAQKAYQGALDEMDAACGGMIRQAAADIQAQYRQHPEWGKMPMRCVDALQSGKPLKDIIHVGVRDGAISISELDNQTGLPVRDVTAMFTKNI